MGANATPQSALRCAGAIGGDYRLFTLPVNLPWDALRRKELVVIIQLYRDTYYSRNSFVLETQVKEFARRCDLAYSKTRAALKELEDKKLVRLTRLMKDQKISEWGTKIELMDPMQSGKTLWELAGEHEVEFESKTPEEWYSLMFYGKPGKVENRPTPPLIDPGDPAQIGSRGGQKHPCPLRRLTWVRTKIGGWEQKEVPCNGSTSKERNKLVLAFYDTPDEYGRMDSWKCFKCGKGGDCHSLWLRLWPELKGKLAGVGPFSSRYEALKAQEAADYAAKLDAAKTERQREWDQMENGTPYDENEEKAPWIA